MKKPGEERQIAKMGPAGGPLPEGRVLYKLIQREPRIVEAKVIERASGKTWTAIGPTRRDAFHALLSSLETASKDESARRMLGLIERPPRRGPAQGGLL
jgi:hypothetical protein